MTDPRPARVRNAEETILDLHAEIERLRTALHEIRDHGMSWGGQACARHAWLAVGDNQQVAGEKK